MTHPAALVQIYFAAIGAACLALSVWLAARRVYLLVHGAVAVGSVVAHEVREYDEGSAHLPVVTFVDANGQNHRFTSATGAIRRRQPHGSVTLVRYLPSNPRFACIQTFTHLWAAPLAFAVLGLAGLSIMWFR